MKVIILLMVLFSFSPVVKAQRSLLEDLPENVAESFKHKYKLVQVKKVSQAEDFFEVSFNKNGEDFTAAFNQAGQWTRTDKYINVKVLPAHVYQAFRKSQYGKMSLASVNQVVFAGFEERPLYQIKVTGNSQDYDLYYDNEGSLVMKVYNTQLKLSQN